MTPEQRFRAKVAPANAAGCWLWTAGTNRGGYGVLKVGSRQVIAHRYAWSLESGPVPDGLCVLHRCDVRACCNPAHLFLGTKADNNTDRAAKGRNRDQRGSKHNMAKLTEASAVEIFLASGTQQAIADRHGVSRPLVGYVKRRKIWTHVTADLR